MCGCATTERDLNTLSEHAVGGREDSHVLSTVDPLLTRTPWPRLPLPVTPWVGLPGLVRPTLPGVTAAFFRATGPLCYGQKDAAARHSETRWENGPEAATPTSCPRLPPRREPPVRPPGTCSIHRRLVSWAARHLPSRLHVHWASAGQRLLVACGDLFTPPLSLDYITRHVGRGSKLPVT